MGNTLKMTLVALMLQGVATQNLMASTDASAASVGYVPGMAMSVAQYEGIWMPIAYAIQKEDYSEAKQLLGRVSYIPTAESFLTLKDQPSTSGALFTGAFFQKMIQVAYCYAKEEGYGHRGHDGAINFVKFLYISGLIPNDASLFAIMGSGLPSGCFEYMPDSLAR